MNSKVHWDADHVNAFIENLLKVGPNDNICSRYIQFNDKCIFRHKCTRKHININSGMKINTVIPMTKQFFIDNADTFQTEQEIIYDYFWVSHKKLYINRNRDEIEFDDENFLFTGNKNIPNKASIFKRNKDLLRLYVNERYHYSNFNHEGYLCILYHNTVSNSFDFQLGITGTVELFDFKSGDIQETFSNGCIREIHEELTNNEEQFDILLSTKFKLHIEKYGQSANIYDVYYMCEAFLVDKESL